ncbi:MAG: hypothetical protein H7Y43_09795 [Akkermansiaceae bacterium]|nr:hypothetical protein [Verrucomicrobiales bacterium]
MKIQLINHKALRTPKKGGTPTAPAARKSAAAPKVLLAEVRGLIVSARGQVEQLVNVGLTMLYWLIGQRVRQDVLKQERAGYGEKIVVSLIRQLSWTHFLRLIPIEHSLKRDFYAEMCRVERWSVRMLEKTIDGLLFERTALSPGWKAGEVLRHDHP